MRPTIKGMSSSKDGGYATDVNYPSKLISIIDKYNLTQYDNITTLPDEPDVPDNPDTPVEEPVFPSKEYAGKTFL